MTDNPETTVAEILEGYPPELRELVAAWIPLDRYASAAGLQATSVEILSAARYDALAQSVAELAADVRRVGHDPAVRGPFLDDYRARIETIALEEALPRLEATVYAFEEAREAALDHDHDDELACTCSVACESETDDGCRYCRTVDPELPCPNLDTPGDEFPETP